MLTCKNISLEEINNLDELIKESTTATFFQTRDWINLWLKHFDGKSLILGVYEGENLVGVVPLDEGGTEINFLGTVPVLGKELVTDFGDIVAKKSREREVWQAVLNRMKSRRMRDPAEAGNRESGLPAQAGIKNIIFNFIREDSPSFKILQELGGRAQEVDVAPYIELPNTWEEYLESLDRHDRHELRRKLRRLEENGAFKVCHARLPPAYHPPAGEAGRGRTRQDGDPADIEEFFRLMILTNEQKRNFLSKEMKSFFKDIFTVFWPRKMLSLCFLKLEGKNIAAAVSFLFKKELLLYNSGFDPEFSNLAPGFLLKAFLIKHAIEEGNKRFDFLRGGERYKYDLGGRERKLYKVML